MEFTRYSAKLLLEAGELQEKKGKDYQNPNSRVKQSDYYPRGIDSIMDIVNAKYLRTISVLDSMRHGGAVNFESVEDSLLDSINYQSFAIAWVHGEIEGQDGTKDIFGNPITNDTERTLIPFKFRKAVGEDKV